MVLVPSYLSLHLYSCLTQLLSADIDTDATQATMRLLLRLTRVPSLAALFVQKEGPQALLSLTHKSNFQGFTSLASLLFRHVLEDGMLLEQAVESMVRAVIAGSTSLSAREFKVHGPACRDFDYVLRLLSPCACRADKLFVDTALRVLRLTNLPPKLEEYLNSNRLAPTILKSIGSVQLDTIPLSQPQKSLLNLLIDQLCADTFMEVQGGENVVVNQPKLDEERPDVTCSRQGGIRLRSYPRMSTGGRTRRNSYRRQLTGNEDDDDLRSEDMVLDSEPTGETGEASQERSVSSSAADQPGTADKEGKETLKEGGEDEKQQKRLIFSQAAILRLLAELIESYPACARMVIESTKRIKIGGQQTKVTCFWLSIVCHPSYTTEYQLANFYG